MSDDRRYPKRPIVGVGALIFRARAHPDGAARQGTAQGLVVAAGRRPRTRREPGAGVRREVREETGLEVEPVKVFEIFERIMRDAEGAPEYHYVLIDYVCRVTGGSLRAGDDVCAVAWVAREDLQRPANHRRHAGRD